MRGSAFAIPCSAKSLGILGWVGNEAAWVLQDLFGSLDHWLLLVGMQPGRSHATLMQCAIAL